MLRWLGKTLGSSIGKKAVLAATGLLLVGYLVEHLLGNATLYRDADGTAFDRYVAFMLGLKPLLYVAEVLLALLFVCHIAIALRITLENREARSTRYVVREDRGAKTAGSASMFVTGALLLAFLLKHLYDFRFDARFAEDPAGLVKSTLARPATATFYVLAMAALGLHLSHGFRSAFQSLGANHPRWNPLLVRTGWALALFFALAFASFPLYFALFWEGGTAP
jgi:succinate dehydrogenase / fumarate reductase cytochrome b subunit